jgi:hypothetical protein
MGPIARRLWRRAHFLPSDVAPVVSEGLIETTADDVYDGQAGLRVADDDHTVRTRLIGHVDPVDGKYHWRGTIFDELGDDVLKRPEALLTINGRTAAARLTERSAQGGYSVVGVGAPPFA